MTANQMVQFLEDLAPSREPEMEDWMSATAIRREVLWLCQVNNLLRAANYVKVPDGSMGLMGHADRTKADVAFERGDTPMAFAASLVATTPTQFCIGCKGNAPLEGSLICGDCAWQNSGAVRVRRGE